jgi:hypothetical protein
MMQDGFDIPRPMNFWQRSARRSHSAT